MLSLCLENPYQREYTAEIVEVLEKDNMYHVVLDNTYFYKGGDFIPYDKGTINGQTLLGVFERDGKVYHTLQGKPARIHRVKCEIDWKRRFDYMQQHLGHQILTNLFLEHYYANMVGFKATEASLYIDIDKYIGPEEISRVETIANNIVSEGINIEAFSPTNAELKKLKNVKFSKKTNENVRLVKIGDLEAFSCHELLPKSTIEAQLIKVTGFEKLKTGTRIHYLCGSRAVTDYIFKHESLVRMARYLSCKPNELTERVEGLSTELNKALSEKRTLKAEVADYEVKDMLNKAEAIGYFKIIKSIYDDVDIKYLDTLASKLVSTPSVIVLFATRNQDRAQLLFMRSRDLKNINMGIILKDAITLIDGKGGGSEFAAQGGGKNNNNLDSMMDYAYNRVEQILSISKK